MGRKSIQKGVTLELLVPVPSTDFFSHSCSGYFHPLRRNRYYRETSSDIHANTDTLSPQRLFLSYHLIRIGNTS